MRLDDRDIRFGDFVFSPSDLSLKRNGETVALNRQSAEVLGYLLQNRHRTVSRDELINKFWSETKVGADDRLNSCIRRIRKVIDNGAESLIETRPRVGYRFAGNVQLADTAATPPGLQPSFLAPLRFNTKAVIAACCIMLGALIAPIILSGGVSAETPDSVYKNDGYTLQKFGALTSNCDFDSDAAVGACTVKGSGFIRILFNDRLTYESEELQNEVLNCTLENQTAVCNT